MPRHKSGGLEARLYLVSLLKDGYSGEEEHGLFQFFISGVISGVLGRTDSLIRAMLWIVGANSVIGAALERVCRRDRLDFTTSARRVSEGESGVALDLEVDPADWRFPPGPGCAILCAAITQLNLCESDPAGTGFINVVRTLDLACRLRKEGWRVIYLSSNLVFNGEAPFVPEDYPYSPLTEYGRQKVLVEQKLLEWGKDAAVVRFTKIIGPGFGLFRGWRDRLKEGLDIKPFRDFFFAPLSFDFVAEQLIRIAQDSASGVIHLGGKRDIAYADAAVLMADYFGFSREAIVPISCLEGGGVYLPRGRYTTLDSRRVDLKPVDTPTVEEILVDCFRRMT